MTTFTDKEIVDTALAIIHKSAALFHDGKLSRSEKEGAVSALVALVTSLGIPVVFTPDTERTN